MAPVVHIPSVYVSSTFGSPCLVQIGPPTSYKKCRRLVLPVPTKMSQIGPTYEKNPGERCTQSAPRENGVPNGVAKMQNKKCYKKQIGPTYENVVGRVAGPGSG